MTTRQRLLQLVGSLLVGALLVAPASAQTQTAAPVTSTPSAVPAKPPPSPQAPQTSTAPDQAPALSDGQLNRIRRALNAGPNFPVTDQELRFYVRVLEKAPSFNDFLKGYDLLNGPTRRGNPMTHAEYVAMVTPKELYSSSTITASELLQFAVTNWMGQTLIKHAIQDMRNARDDHDLQEIRERIDSELAMIAAGNARTDETPAISAVAPAPAPAATPTPAASDPDGSK